MMLARSAQESCVTLFTVCAVSASTRTGQTWRSQSSVLTDGPSPWWEVVALWMTWACAASLALCSLVSSQWMLSYPWSHARTYLKVSLERNKILGVVAHAYKSHNRGSKGWRIISVKSHETKPQTKKKKKERPYRSKSLFKGHPPSNVPLPQKCQFKKLQHSTPAQWPPATHWAAMRAGSACGSVPAFLLSTFVPVAPWNCICSLSLGTTGTFQKYLQV